MSIAREILAGERGATGAATAAPASAMAIANDRVDVLHISARQIQCSWYHCTGHARNVPVPPARCVKELSASGGT